jgi:hypothetical protein
VYFYDTEAQRQFARERAEQLAQDMRRARRLGREETNSLSWTRLAAELVSRAERLRRSKGSRAPMHTGSRTTT